MHLAHAPEDFAQDAVGIELRQRLETVAFETFRVLKVRLRELALKLRRGKQRLELAKVVGEHSLDPSQPIGGRRKGLQPAPEFPQPPHKVTSRGRQGASPPVASCAIASRAISSGRGLHGPFFGGGGAGLCGIVRTPIRFPEQIGIWPTSLRAASLTCPGTCLSTVNPCWFE